jgi:hypothetical protein
VGGEVDGEPLLQGDDLGVEVGGQAVGDGPAAAEVPGPVAVEQGSFWPEPMWMAYSSSAYLWPSWPVTRAPTSQPPAPYRS